MRSVRLVRPDEEDGDPARLLLRLWWLPAQISSNSGKLRGRSLNYRDLLVGLIKPVVLGFTIVTIGCSGGIVGPGGASHLLTVTVTGGSGFDSVSSSPSGISCPFDLLGEL